MNRMHITLLSIFLVIVCVAYAGNDSMQMQQLYDRAYDNFDNRKGLDDAARLFVVAENAKDVKMQAKAQLIMAKYYNNALPHDQFEMRARQIMAWLKRNKALDDYYHVWIYVIINKIDDNKFVSAYGEITGMFEEAQKLHSPYGIQAGYRMMGDLLMSRFAYLEAMKYFSQELAYATKIKSPTLYSCYYNIGICKYNMGHYREALEYNKKGMALATKPSVIVGFYIQRGLAYAMMGRYAELKECYQYVNRYASHYPLDNKLVGEYHTIKAAALWAEHDMEGAKAVIYKMGERERLTVLPVLYQRMGRMTEAYAAQRRLTSYKDSINSIFSTLELNEFGEKVKQQKLLQDKQSLTIEAAKIKDRHQKLVSMFFTLIFIAFAVLVFIVIFLQRRRNRYLLAEKNAKDMFIQDMSHEIRTPLNAISGFSSLLADIGDGLSAEEWTQMVTMINSNTQLLTMILNNMLTLYKLEHGDVKIVEEPCDATSICKEAINKVKEIYKGVVDIRLAEDMPKSKKISTDCGQLINALARLIDNGCKFTEKGSVTVGYDVTEDGRHFEFYVEDTGIGIPADKAEQIFDRFEKLDKFKPGLGLGLTIVRVICIKLGARVFLDTSYQKGSKFVISFV